MSRTFAANAAARSAQAGSSPSSLPYSLTELPQPAAFVTIRSTSGPLERLDQRAGPRLPVLAATRVDRERAAAALLDRRDDLEPVGREHARRSPC